jgi:hypothetical protein
VDIVLPKDTKSKTDIELPIRATPKQDKLLPILEKLRMEIALPKQVASNTDKDEPI